jgi:hypothetical protein
MRKFVAEVTRVAILIVTVGIRDLRELTAVVAAAVAACAATVV